MDDQEIVYCHCPTLDFDRNGVVQRRHDPQCPFGRLRYADAVVQWHLERSLRDAQRRLSPEGAGSVDDTTCSDECSLTIPSKQFARALRSFQIQQGFLSGGFGRKLLSFVRTASKVKKAFRGGVHFRLSRLNMINSAN